VAQASRTAYRAIVSFFTGASPSAWNVVSVWGNATAQQPTIERLAAGRYVIRYASSYKNELGDTEEVNFRFGHADVSVPGFARLDKMASNEVYVSVFDTGWNLSDLGGGALVSAWLR
jgi:hypothetical protein